MATKKKTTQDEINDKAGEILAGDDIVPTVSFDNEDACIAVGELMEQAYDIADKAGIPFIGLALAKHTSYARKEAPDEPIGASTEGKTLYSTLPSVMTKRDASMIFGNLLSDLSQHDLQAVPTYIAEALCEIHPAFRLTLNMVLGFQQCSSSAATMKMKDEILSFINSAEGKEMAAANKTPCPCEDCKAARERKAKLTGAAAEAQAVEDELPDMEQVASNVTSLFTKTKKKQKVN